MTEADWLAADPIALLRWALPRAGVRRFRLYLCGGCRAVAHLLYSPLSLAAVEVAERAADGLASADEVHEAARAAEVPTFGYDFERGVWEGYRKFRPAGRWDADLAPLVERGALAASALTGGEWKVDAAVRDRLIWAADLAWDCVAHAAPPTDGWYAAFKRPEWPGRWLVDCICGNPFRPIPVDPRWLSSAVVGLAAAAYADRGFHRLPVLADALEESGCDDAGLLAHCRSDGPHARGCHAVDLLLGKGQFAAGPL